MRLFCFGMGYSASWIAHLLAARGWECCGTSRSPRPNAPFPLHRFDATHGLDEAGNAALASATHVLHSIPPQEAGDNVLTAADWSALSGLQWMGYFSTTGVYGDHAGGWVDETTPTDPNGARQQRRVEAENAWLQRWQRHGLPVHIFRLAGIYGPGRSAFDSLRDGSARRIDKPGQVFSRIHVADIARVVLASIARPNPGRIYNVCDDLPAPAADVTAYAASLLGIAPPPLQPYATAALSPMARSFYASNRRVKNIRIHEELGVELAYPTYQEGLQAIYAEESPMP